LAVWFAVEQALREADGVERLLPQLETVLGFAAELHDRLSTDGLDGVAGVLGVHRQLLAVFGGITAADLERMRAQAETLQRAFGQLATALEQLKRLKDALRT
jgi:cell division protein FtsB